MNVPLSRRDVARVTGQRSQLQNTTLDDLLHSSNNHIHVLLYAMMRKERPVKNITLT